MQAEIMRKAMELKKDIEASLFPKASKLKGRKLEPKYKDPVSGKTWAGRGRLPKWMVGDKEQYKIGPCGLGDFLGN